MASAGRGVRKCTSTANEVPTLAKAYGRIAMVVLFALFGTAEHLGARAGGRDAVSTRSPILRGMNQVAMLGAVLVPNQHEMQQYGEVRNANQRCDNRRK